MCLEVGRRNAELIEPCRDPVYRVVANEQRGVRRLDIEQDERRRLVRTEYCGFLIQKGMLRGAHRYPWCDLPAYSPRA
jgi:hypothetical protein